jgi:large subunit ribosomal protein L10
MALSREQKESIVAEVVSLLESSKLTAIAQYQGISVKEMQAFRRQAAEQGTTIKVLKNRLVRLAATKSDKLKETDLGELNGQLIYAFNSEDEVAPAQVIAQFAKKHPALKMHAGINDDGVMLSQDDMKALASLPSKEQLRGQLVGTIGAPLSGFVNVLSGNLRGFLNVLSAKAEQA